MGAYDVIVVGLGVMGGAAAYHCARQTRCTRPGKRCECIRSPTRILPWSDTSDLRDVFRGA